MTSVSFKLVQNTKTHILSSITLFSFENHVVYEVILKNMVDPETLQMTTQVSVA